MSGGTASAATAALLQTLRSWSEQGWLRRLDRALAAFMVELCPDAAPAVVLAAAMVAHMEGQGHACLPLDDLALEVSGSGDAPLGWPAGALAGLASCAGGLPADAQGWARVLGASALVAVDGAGCAAAPGDRPLVLRGGKLYLRRLWRCERQVATAVLERVRALPEAAADEVTLRARHWLARLFADAPPPARAAEGPAGAGRAVDGGTGSVAGDAGDAGPERGAGGAHPAGRPARAADAGGDAADAAAEPDWQRLACAVALRARLSIITGGPGTGKTHTAARLLVLRLATDPAPRRLRVALAAPTGKAAARLQQSIEDALQRLQPLLDEAVPGLDAAGLARRWGAARTLHSLLGARPDTRRFRHDAAHPLTADLVIVDEASMIDLEMMAALLQALPPRAGLVLLGDKDQLSSVEAGAVLGDLCAGAEHARYRPAVAAALVRLTGQTLPARHLGAGSPLAQQIVMLRTSHRYGGPIGRLAAAANAGDAALATALLTAAADPALRWLDTTAPAAAVALAVDGRPGAAGGHAGPGGYLELWRRRPRRAGRIDGDGEGDGEDGGGGEDDAAAFEAWAAGLLAAFDRMRLLCAVRAGPWGVDALNLAVEQELVARGLLARRGDWYPGRPVMVTRNDAGLGVSNGDVGIVLAPPDRGAVQQPLRAYFTAGRGVRSVAVSRLAHVTTAYAMTVHKSQGSEFEHTVLVLPPEPSRVLTRELIYTAITRSRSAFTLVTGRAQALPEALARRTRRSSGLMEWLGTGVEGDIESGVGGSP